MFRDHFEFLRQFGAQFHTTGAIAPSSRRLARAITRHVDCTKRPVRILEVGPGTGAFTRRLVGMLRAEDVLDLVELNPTFAALLQERFRSDPAFQRVATQSKVHLCGIESFRPEGQYDHIICGLPFNNFSAEFVEQVFATFFGLLAPGGTLSYFEYMYVRPLRRLVAGRPERTRLTRLDTVLKSYLAGHRLGRDWVFLNVPPAWAQHLRKP